MAQACAHLPREESDTRDRLRQTLQGRCETPWQAKATAIRVRPEQLTCERVGRRPIGVRARGLSAQRAYHADHAERPAPPSAAHRALRWKPNRCEVRKHFHERRSV